MYSLKKKLRLFFQSLYKTLFLYSKGDEVALIEANKLLEKKGLKVGCKGFICEVKYFPGEGWFYHIDFIKSFRLIKTSAVKRTGFGWVRRLKERFLDIEELAEKDNQNKNILWKTESQD